MSIDSWLTHRYAGLVLSFLFLLLSLYLSISLGYRYITLQEIIESLTQDANQASIIVQELRLPRALLAVIVGSALAIAGLLLQTLTKNKLASPGVLGINAGSSLFVVIGSLVFVNRDLHIWWAMMGALVVGVFLLLFGMRSHLHFTLTGAAISALCLALLQGILLLNEKAFDEIMFWLVGSLAVRRWDQILVIIPYIMTGLLLSCVLVFRLNILSIGDDTASGLGLSVRVTKGLVCLAVVLLAGGAVALAGPISFVGLMVPNLLRAFLGDDYRWLLVFSGCYGALFLLWADISCRFINFPEELPVGLLTALLGFPFFLYLARGVTN